LQDNRGLIINRERARQLIDFSGLRYDNITPTDSDAIIDWHNKAWVITEWKYLEAELPFGQRLAFERLTDDLERSGKPTLFMIAAHDVYDCDKDVDSANTPVREYRFKGKWYVFEASLIITVKEMTDIFLNNLGIGEENFSSLCLQCAKTPERISLSSFMK